MSRGRIRWLIKGRKILGRKKTTRRNESQRRGLCWGMMSEGANGEKKDRNTERKRNGGEGKEAKVKGKEKGRKREGGVRKREGKGKEEV